MAARRTDSPSIETLVRRHVESYPGSTCAQINKATGQKSASVSGLLVKLCDAGVLRREKGRGPRNGYGYYAVKTLPKDDVPTWHERLLNDD